MSNIACRCGDVIARPRGMDRVRMVAQKVVVIRLREDGTQALEVVCPACRADVSIPLPLSLQSFNASGAAAVRDAAKSI